MTKPEWYDGENWETCQDGAEVSVSNAPTTPIPISGSLTVTAGSINMTLGAELNALSAFSQNGIMARTGTGSYTARAITAGSGISVINGNGISGNPTIALGTVPIDKIAGYPNIITNNTTVYSVGSLIELQENGLQRITLGFVKSDDSTYLKTHQSGSFDIMSGASKKITVNSSSSINFHSNRISNLANPLNDLDAANKSYIDNRVIPINKLANYPNNTNKVLYGDGAWRELNLPNNIATTTYVDDSIANHIIPINKLAGYPNNSSYLLKGNGTWGVFTPDFTSYSSAYNIPVNNTYSSATETGFDFKTNGISGFKIGLNNSNMRGYLKHLQSTGLIDFIFDNNLAMTVNKDGVNINGLLALNTSSSYYNIPINNTNTSAVETGLDIKQNGSMGFKVGHNSSTGRSYLKTRAGSTIEHYVGSTLSLKVWTTGIALNNGRIFELGEPVNSTDAATKSYVDNAVSTGSGGSSVLDPINLPVNTGGGQNNWLNRGYITKTNVTIYGMNNSNGFILENYYGESAGIAFSGNQDNCTIWTAGDNGSYLNIQDEDSSNSRKAYVNTSGSWVSVSSKERKYSIRDKSNNNILNRFMDVKVKTYGHKYDEGKFNKKKTERIARKSKEMATGLILEDLFKIFPNCISDYRNELFQKKDKKKKLSLEKEVKDIKNAGIDYNTLMCYFIMAFQEFVEKTNNKIKQLEGKND